MHRTLLLLGVLLAAWLPGAVLAQSSDGEGQEEVASDWSEERRDVTARNDEAGFHFESERRTDLGRDQLLGQFDVTDARFIYEYVSTEPGNETILRMTLDFVAVVAFEDTDADGRYGFGDATLQRIELADRPGAAASQQPNCLTGVGCTLAVQIPINGTDDGALPVGNPTLAQGMLTLTFHVLEQRAIIGTQALPPTQTKFDIEIADFPYNEGENPTHVALETRLSANQALVPESMAIGTSSRPFELFYAWTRQATAGEAPVPVGVSVIHDGGDDAEGASRQPSTVAFAYPAGEDVRHDPSLGVMRFRPVVGPADIVEAFFKGDWRIYGTAFVLASSVVAASAAYRLRRG